MSCASQPSVSEKLASIFRNISAAKIEASFNTLKDLDEEEKMLYGESREPQNGKCTLACVPFGVVFVLAEPSSWRTGVVLVGAGSFLGFCCPLPSAFWSPTTCVAVFPCACGLLGCCFFPSPKGLYYPISHMQLHLCKTYLKSRMRSQSCPTKQDRQT